MTCALPVVPAQTLQERMYARARAERIPLQVDIEIISTCNFKCVHCYIAPVACREDVMSLERARELFRKLADAGTMFVLLTGGEIFTHKQFKEIYLSAKRAGLIVYLNTNAYLIGERWADFLAEHPPAKISISIYGMSPGSYERLTGVPRSYERCMRAIDLLQERGLSLDLKCPAMTLTADELPAMRRFAYDRGLNFRFDPMMIPRRDGDAQPLDLQLSPHEVVDIERDMDPGLEVLRDFAEPRLGSRNGQIYMCGAGRTMFAVDVHGGVSTCTSSRQTVANIFEQPFEEVWGSLGGKVSRKFPVGHPCATCKFRGMCAGCPATVEQMTGLPEGYVQSFCRVTHLKAQALGWHESGVPRTEIDGIPAGVVTQPRVARSLPILH